MSLCIMLCYAICYNLPKPSRWLYYHARSLSSLHVLCCIRCIAREELSSKKCHHAFVCPAMLRKEIDRSASPILRALADEVDGLAVASVLGRRRDAVVDQLLGIGDALDLGAGASCDIVRINTLSTW